MDESAVRNSWITAPCSCCLALWASLGEMIEGGAEQIVGLLLFPLSLLTYFYFAVSDGALDPMTWIEGSTCAWLGLIGAGCEGAGGGDDGNAAGAPPPPPWVCKKRDPAQHSASGCELAVNTRPPSLSPRTVTPTGKNYTLQFTPSVVYRFTHR